MAMVTAMSPSAASRSALAGPAAAHLRHPLARALIVLTFTTGLVDAVSYLGLGHVFTANMTGNVVLLGFGLAGGTGLPVLARGHSSAGHDRGRDRDRDARRSDGHPQRGRAVVRRP
jgi:Protein of unknown function (DUF1275)